MEQTLSFQVILQPIYAGLRVSEAGQRCDDGGDDKESGAKGGVIEVWCYLEQRTTEEMARLN